ncbi:hypothetical protein EVAR_100726_1 [Eumeta japonica]|uniref:Uncharacterized protein n=1 Tax=Eumeta variegata TaxID=151549 RepID=A0A4C1S8R0_EUMVA|nr:hypothetical protein EVAR_100726_1 [Eumeta japonica]
MYFLLLRIIRPNVDMKQSRGVALHYECYLHLCLVRRLVVLPRRAVVRTVRLAESRCNTIRVWSGPSPPHKLNVVLDTIYADDGGFLSCDYCHLSNGQMSPDVPHYR